MKNIVKKSVITYNIILWTIFSLLGLIAIGKYFQLFLNDLSNKADIFIPGVVILVAITLLLEFFFITRVIKYIKLMKNNK
ncbi:hypothetical protein [Fusobacterium sp. PH5-44]|uniref:hypothetical protein n=1 Tax=unclassified Fusobacterium TaxID=2648384 RepID=UPI003D1D40D0